MTSARFCCISSSVIDSIEELQIFRKTCSSIFHIDKIQPGLQYNQFFNKYLLPNKPCVFSQEYTAHWQSRKKWVTDDGHPDFVYLQKHFGEATVPVANCNEEKYSSHPKVDMTLADYLDYWESYRTKSYPADEPCLYLKDWHFTHVFPDYPAYTTPVYFCSDWLNEFWDSQGQDDYRFVYMGPQGTWTPFHADVYRSYSWSANICGRKKWIFYPPGQEEFLKDRYNQLVYDVTSGELNNQWKFPKYRSDKVQRLEVIQEAGEIIFVPSGWHHQVYNLKDTISINHNWLNGCNVDLCWDHIKTCMEDVKREIEDCKDMEGWQEQCQLILNASAGINYKIFFNFVKVIAENRLKVLGQNRSAKTTKIEFRNTGKGGEQKELNNGVETTPEVPKKLFYKQEKKDLQCKHRLIDNLHSKCSLAEDLVCKQDCSNYSLQKTDSAECLLTTEYLGKSLQCKQSPTEGKGVPRKQEMTNSLQCKHVSTDIVQSKTDCLQCKHVSNEVVQSKQDSDCLPCKQISTDVRSKLDSLDDLHCKENPTEDKLCEEDSFRKEDVTVSDSSKRNFSTNCDKDLRSSVAKKFENLHLREVSDSEKENSDLRSKFDDQHANMFNVMEIEVEQRKCSGDVNSTKQINNTNLIQKITADLEGEEQKAIYFSKSHITFDLQRVKYIVENMLKDPDFSEIDTCDLVCLPQELMKKIENGLTSL